MGDQVVNRGTFRGTHSGDIVKLRMPIPGTGRRLSVVNFVGGPKRPSRAGLLPHLFVERAALPNAGTNIYALFMARSATFMRCLFLIDYTITIVSQHGSLLAANLAGRKKHRSPEE
jgi:hypothetical protein